MIKSKLMSGMTKEQRKTAFIIMGAITDFHIRQGKLGNLRALWIKPRDITSGQIEQLSHFAKQGVKVRLK